MRYRRIIMLGGALLLALVIAVAINIGRTRDSAPAAVAHPVDRQPPVAEPAPVVEPTVAASVEDEPKTPTPVQGYMAAGSATSLPVPASVRRVVARTNVEASARVRIVHNLSGRLGAQERAALYAFLLDPDRVDGLTPDQEYVLVNEIMELLRQQVDHAPEFGAILAAIFRDPRQATVVRDYAIQHLGEWALANDIDENVASAFAEALAETRSSIAGTSLIALNKLAAETDKVPTSAVADAALILVSDTSANAGSRATAMAICGERAVTNALPVARHAAQDAALSLRVASIAYVGSVGDTDDMIWLTDIAANTSETHAKAAMSAVQAIEARKSKGEI